MWAVMLKMNGLRAPEIGYWPLVVIHEKGWQWALPLFFFLVEFEVALGNGLLQHMERTSGQERFSFSLDITCRKTMWI